MKDEEYRVYEGLPYKRNLRDVVDCLGLGCICIYIVAEADSVLLQEFEDGLVRIFLRSVECHMLEEVGQTVLVVLFLKCADIVYDVEIRTTLVFSVVTEIICQAVFELSDSGARIVRYLLS